MASAVGIDLVDSRRFGEAIRRWPRLLDRVFTEEERGAGGLDDDRLGACFAVKEAAFKALGEGWPAVAYSDVEVRHSPSGAPAIGFGERAAELAAGRTAAVSISHEGHLAIAVVFLIDGTSS